MLLGSSRQYDEEDAAVDFAILNRMLSRSLEYMPALGGLSSIRVWTGLRAATPDSLPLIGPSLESDRIWLATGHEGLGITTSVGTGRLLADLLLNRPCEIPPEPYAPSRFASGAGATHHA
jgi:glycine/D-amino acid oxidase-like deaminating enzyme